MPRRSKRKAKRPRQPERTEAGENSPWDLALELAELIGGDESDGVFWAMHEQFLSDTLEAETDGDAPDESDGELPF